MSLQSPQYFPPQESELQLVLGRRCVHSGLSVCFPQPVAAIRAQRGWPALCSVRATFARKQVWKN